MILTAEFTTHVLVRVVYESRRANGDEVEMHELISASGSETTTVAVVEIGDIVTARGDSRDVVPDIAAPSSSDVVVVESAVSPAVDAMLKALAAVGPQARSFFDDKA